MQYVLYNYHLLSLIIIFHCTHQVRQHDQVKTLVRDIAAYQPHLAQADGYGAACVHLLYEWVVLTLSALSKAHSLALLRRHATAPMVPPLIGYWLSSLIFLYFTSGKSLLRVFSTIRFVRFVFKDIFGLIIL